MRLLLKALVQRDKFDPGREDRRISLSNYILPWFQYRPLVVVCLVMRSMEILLNH